MSVLKVARALAALSVDDRKLAIGFAKELRGPVAKRKYTRRKKVANAPAAQRKPRVKKLVDQEEAGK